MATAKSKVYMRDAAAVSRRILSFTAGGRENLQVISDFDYTITRFTAADGTRTNSSHGVVESSDLLGPEYHDKAKAAFNKYYPIEGDHTMSEAEKLPWMEEWWNTAHGLIVEAGLNKSVLTAMVQRSNIGFREGFEKAVAVLSEEQVPFLVFSAGLRDVIDEVFRQRLTPTRPSNMHIVSNKMVFDHDGRVTGFDGHNIHTLNKNGSATVGTPYEKETMTRKNIILAGDNLGDVKMSDGFAGAEVLSFGFLNDKVEERLDQYQAAYDVVITGTAGHDGTFEPVLDAILAILGRV